MPRIVTCDIETGAQSVVDIHIDGVITEAESKSLADEAVKAANNSAIKAQLDANDLRIIRALLEDLPGLLSGADSLLRIEEHKAAQAALRAQLLP